MGEAVGGEVVVKVFLYFCPMIDPFAPTYEAVPEAATQAQPAALSLFELNARVRAMLHHTLPDCYWVAAEISELRVASNGHCYLELVQKDTFSGSLVAKARAMIWRQNYVMVSSHFEHATQQRLTAGIKVLVYVSVEFHELYGYSLNIVDIDPTYTLGDLAQRRQEIIRQLQEDGVMDLNKELPLPRVMRRIAVISSATAAGYGDFCNQLQQSGYDFTLKLFPAIMQGDKVERSVIDALDAIAAECDEWDVVVIIRGGGATTDLNGFESYLLAANVAQFPLPILTGIGHERDDTVIDLVANTRLKTPTAVAAFLIERRGNETALLQGLTERLLNAVQQRLSAEQNQLKALEQQLQYAVERQTMRQRQQFDTLAHRYELASTQYVGRQREQLTRLALRLEAFAQSDLQRERQRLQQQPLRIATAIERLLVQRHHQLELLQRSVKLAGPDRILAMGFSITTHEGKAVRNAEDVKQGDELTTTFAHGSIKSIVK